MGLKALWMKSRLRERWHKCLFYNDYRRIRRLYRNDGWRGLRFLLPGHLWLDSVEVVVTTRCNLRCPDCSNLMQYYDSPYDVDLDVVLSSMRKLNAAFDWCDLYKVLGGEPLLYSKLAAVLEEIPSEKCGKAILYTNATIVPEDPALFDVLRRKRVVVYISNYLAARETQEKLIEKLEQENVSYMVVKSDTWTDYGAVSNHEVCAEELQRQFTQCFIPCKSLLNGCLYYCPRSGHGYDLGLIDRKSGEYVDILHNTTAQNRREIRRLMWRHRPIEACKYCQHGTAAAVKIPRGKQPAIKTKSARRN